MITINLSQIFKYTFLKIIILVIIHVLWYHKHKFDLTNHILHHILTEWFILIKEKVNHYKYSLFSIKFGKIYWTCILQCKIFDITFFEIFYQSYIVQLYCVVDIPFKYNKRYYLFFHKNKISLILQIVNKVNKFTMVLPLLWIRSAI